MQFTTKLIVLIALLKLNATEDIIVRTKLGEIQGSLMTSLSGQDIYAFRGIRFAEPPVGPLRFRDPIPVRPWKSVFDATQEGPACIQTKGINLSEDCLVLNIYTKQMGGAKLPVIIFLPPGGYFQSSAQSSLFGPKYLLDHDIVLVTVNYRLGILGFLNTGDTYATGNYAFKDQLLAMKFVRDNIAAFGGDSDSVTLASYSAGARSAILHMVSPLSRGLFHRVIAMSGSPTTPIPPLREQIDVAEKQAKFLNCTTETREKMFKCLREKPAEEFGSTVKRFLEWHSFPALVWYPSIEPDIPDIEAFLPDEPEKIMRSGQIAQVPLVIGVTKDEFSYAATLGIWEAKHGNTSYFQELNDDWYRLAPICFGYERNTERSRFISNELRKFYFNNESIALENSDSLRQLFANSIVHFPVYRAASLISQFSSAPVYFYEFSYQGRYSNQKWPDSGKPKGGVAHGDDLQYLFNMNTDAYDFPKSFPLHGKDDPENLLVKRWTSIWVHFATTGEPLPRNVELFDSIDWERLTPENKKYLHFGEEIKSENDFLGEQMRLWDSLFP